MSSQRQADPGLGRIRNSLFRSVEENVSILRKREFPYQNGNKWTIRFFGCNLCHMGKTGRRRMVAGVLLLGAWSLCSLLCALDPEREITQYSHQVWRLRDGLPSMSVETILQTRDGYLWLGTHTGLVRFDGAQFVRPAGLPPALFDDRVNCLLEDHEGTLWVGTDGIGVFRLESGRISVLSIREGLSQEYVRSILQTADKAVWLGLGGAGVNRFSGNVLAAYRPADSHVYALMEDRTGSLWAGTAGGLEIFREGGFQPVKEGLGRVHINALLQDGKGRVWVGTRRGVRLKEADRFRDVTAECGLPAVNVSALLEDRNGNIWFATSGFGLFRLKNGEVRRSALSSFTTASGLSDDSVLALAEDQEGNLWVGTADGLNRLRDVNCVTYSMQEGLSDDRVLSLCETSDGSLWMSTLRGGLTRMKDGRFTHYSRRDGLELEYPSTLWPSQDGGLWIGSANGLAHWRNGKFQSYSSAQGLLSERVTAVFQQASGRVLLGQAGVTVLDNGSFTQFQPDNQNNTVFIYWISEDRNGSVWLGCSAGLGRFQEGAYKLYTEHDGLPDNTVHSVHEDETGTLWIATRGGLARMRDGRITAIRPQDGLPDRLIFRILPDDFGHFWMNCSKGIFRVRKQELDDFAEGRRSSINYVLYDSADGMKSAQYLAAKQPAGWRSRNGILWFPTTRGIVRIDPAAIRVNQRPPKVFIEGVVADGSSFEGPSGIRIPPGPRNIEFHYSALCLSVPQKVRFEYRIRDFDWGWTDAGTRRTAYLKGLPAGNYVFELRACNSDWVWTASPAELSFAVAPFFYQTAWFYGFLVLLLGSLLITAHRLKMRRAHTRFATVLAERNRVAREIHDTVLQGFAGVAYQLEGLVETLPESQVGVRQKLEKILSKVSKSLIETRHSIWQLRSVGLEDEKNLAESLAEIVRDLSEGHPALIDFRVRDAARPLPEAVEQNLLQIGKEAISNALRHSGASKILVDLDFDIDYIGLRIQDDGQGFKLPARVAKDGHFGLVGMQERAAEIGAQLSITSEGRGTEVLVVAPIPKAEAPG
jgi:ligand-binding sensor domain-containing protein/signal transduction histidine kinase